MKTPEEIKKGLAEAPEVKYVVDDPSRDDVHYERYGVAIDYILRDQVYIYITQLENAVGFYSDTSQRLDAKAAKLESRLAKVERERDAAVADIRKASSFLCRVCTKNDWPNCAAGRNNLYSDDVVECEDFEWRGVCEENTTPETTNEVRKDDTEN